MAEPDIEAQLRFALNACKMAGLHLLNALRAESIEPDEIGTHAAAKEQVWPTEWAYDAWMAWRACKAALAHAGWDDANELIATDKRTEWRTTSAYRGPVAGSLYFSDATVLVVDDDSLTRKVWRALLEGEGYTVTEARDGELALKLAKERRPDLIVLDLLMPGMDGLDCLRGLKDDPMLESVPVLVVTAKPEVEERLHALASGADDYLTKPVEDPAFLDAIWRLLVRTAPPDFA